MNLSVNIISLLTLLITLSPFFLSVFLVLESFGRNAPLQGFLYVLGLIFIQSIGYLSRPIFGNMGIRPDIKALFSGEKQIIRNRACELIPDPYNSKYSCPSFHGIYHAFTLFYVFGNEIFDTSSFSRNMPLFVTFLTFALSDAIFRITGKCVTIFHYLFGILFGFCGAFAWFKLIQLSTPEHTYRSYITDKKSCKFTKQNFDCKLEVYEFDDKNSKDPGRKLSDDEIKRLTASEWKNAMANMALGKKVDSSHKHKAPAHKHSVNVTQLNRNTITSTHPIFDTLPSI